jgi:uncharacterized protein
MTMDVALAALDFAGRSNPGRSAGIVLFGGEPLLRKDFMRSIVGEAEKRARQGRGRYHFKITTNGLAIDEEFLSWSVGNHVQVAMSFDGIREAQDCHRRLVDDRPTFDLLLPRLRMLLAFRPYAPVYMVVTPDTLRHMADSVAFLVEEKVRHVALSLNVAARWTEDDFAELRAQYQRLADFYITWSRQGRKFYLSPFENKIASQVQGKDWHRCRCALADTQVSVDPEGWLYPCIQFPRAGTSWRVGHVRTGFDTEARTRIRELANVEKQPCATCAMQDRCTNTCGCVSLQETGTITRVSEVHCRDERIVLPIADRVGETLFREENRAFLLKHYDPLGPLRSLMEDVLP